MPEHGELLEEFRKALRSSTPVEVVRRAVLAGDCNAINSVTYNRLRASVAAQFSIHPNEVFVVGSAKLGFSIAPAKRYRPFGERSDIDVVLCSSGLFDQIWQAVFDHWDRGETWDGLRDFRKYLFRGWIRPDFLPPTRSFSVGQDWWDFFRELAASGEYGPYKITGALYKSRHFIERYQYGCVQQCWSEEVGSQ